MNNVDLRKDVFAWYGAACYYAQCFEVELIILLICMARLREPGVTQDELERLDSDLSKKTLGKLLSELRGHAVLHPDFGRLLDSYLDKRNYLIHHFFYTNALKLTSSQGCEQMEAELRELSADFREANAIAEAMSERVRAHLGWSKEQIDHIVSRLLSGRARRGGEDGA